MPDTTFITGTDTDVGKTLITAGLLEALRLRGRSSAAIKPVAAGAVQTADGWRNDDGLLLQRYQSANLSYQQVNPVLLKAPLAPHIAAEREGRRVTASQLVGYCRGVMMQPVDAVLIEGAGGWRTPINAVERLSALPRELQTPVVLVVGLQLGCINHALLTAEAIARDGLTVLAWVANQIDPRMAEVDANIASLKAALPSVFLGYVPFLEQPTPERVAACLEPCACELLIRSLE